MAPAFSEVVPNADDLLALGVEELAGVLLMHLNSYEGAFSQSIGCINHALFFNDLRTAPPLGQLPYGGYRQPEVSRALKEAWAWLEHEGFLVKDPVHGVDQFFISRRGQHLKSREDFDAYRKKAPTMSTAKRKLITSVLEEVRNFRFCGPSDDPDEQTAVTLGYRYLVIQLKRLVCPILPDNAASRLNAIDVEVNNLYSAFEANAELDALLPDIESASNT